MLFYKDVKVIEEKSDFDFKRPSNQLCPYCNYKLAYGVDDSYDTYNDYHITSLLCFRCGWWDYKHSTYLDDGRTPGGWSKYVNSILHDSAINEKVEFATLQLVNELFLNHNKIYKLSPDKFENLIEYFYKNYFLCSTELTAKTRDGGIDIIGIDSEYQKFAIEVKRYKNKITVQLIRQFLGALIQHDITKGIFVTSSTYTRDSKNLVNKINNKGYFSLELKDISNVIDWLKINFNKYFNYEEIKRKIEKNVLAYNVYFPKEYIFDKKTILEYDRGNNCFVRKKRKPGPYDKIIFP
ncbi:MAG: restriction endonuclease [Bacteroidales bacterium]|nr:restriction endonuclease [Bacteroidales bacterium]